MAEAFGTGFAGGFGQRAQGELLLICRPHPRYSDGDILMSKNRRQIRYCHAQHLSSVKEAGFNGDGLRPSGTLYEINRQKTCLWKMQRVSSTECRRTNLDTLDEEIVGPTPTAEGYFIHVQRFIDLRMNHARHGLFGTAGSEYWYEGYRKTAEPNHMRLDEWWQEIEARTSYIEADFLRWPFTLKERSGFLALAVNDFEDASGAELMRPLLDETILEIPIIVELRKHTISWRELSSIGSVAAIENKDVDVDVRGLRDHVRQVIVQEKTI